MPEPEIDKRLSLDASPDEKRIALQILTASIDDLILEDQASLEQRRQVLSDNLARWREQTKPVSIDRIRAMLERLAKHYRVPAPDHDDLVIYCAVLGLMPSVAFNVAWRTVLATHRFKSLPVAADFMRAGQETTDRSRRMIDHIQHCINKIDRAIEEKNK